MRWDGYGRIVLILGMAAVLCGTANAVVGVGAQTQAMSAGDYPVCTEPCECITESTAAMRWGAQGYEKCSKTISGQDAGGDVQYYCIHRVGGMAAAAETGTPGTAAAATTVPVVSTAAMVQETTGPLQGTSHAVTALPSSAWPAADAIPQKTPVGIVTLLAAIGAALLAARCMQRR